MREKATSSQIKPCHEGATREKRARGPPTQGGGPQGGEEQLQGANPRGRHGQDTALPYPQHIGGGGRADRIEGASTGPVPTTLRSHLTELERPHGATLGVSVAGEGEGDGTVSALAQGSGCHALLPFR